MATKRGFNKGSKKGRRDVKCSFCTENKKVTNAEYYCHNCQKHMCTSCYGKHNDLYENHNVVEGHRDDRDLKTEKCEKHTDELITFYCRPHDKMLCTKCRFEDHRSCQDTQHILKSSDELNAKPELQAFTEELELARADVNKVNKDLDIHLASIQQKEIRLLSGLEDDERKQLSEIKEKNEKSKKEIKSKKEELDLVVRQHQDKCKSIEKEIDQCLSQIKKANKRKTNVRIHKKKVQTIKEKVVGLYNEKVSLLKACQLNFKRDMTTFDSPTSLYKKDSPRALDISSYSAVGGKVDRPVHATVTMPEEQVVRPGKKPAIDIGIQGDTTTCSTKDCCILGDGSLVIADGNNRRLKRVDPSSSNVTEYPIDIQPDNQPVSVCCIGPKKTQRATLSHNQTDLGQKDSGLHFLVALGCTQVHEYNAEDITQTRPIDFGHDTCSIACHGDLLYASSGKTLYVHNLGDGRMLREIYKDNDDQDLFSQISGIAMNGPGDRVYVADWWKGLVCVSKDGQLQFKLSEEDLKLSLAWGVATDHYGHVFVSGMGSHNVVKVTVTGKKPVAQQILSRDDEIVNPCGLSYDMSSNCLFVGGWNSNKLQMFKMGKSESSRSKTIRKINVRIPDDKESCVVSGCCDLSDGSIMIADGINRRLKRVDPSSSKVTKDCVIEKQPTDVCTTGPQEFAVAFGSTQVQIYCAVCLTRTRTVELGHYTSKIACHGRLLYCAGGWGDTLYVHDVSDGRKLREIRHKMLHISGIAVNGPGDRLYVTDRWSGLVCVNTDDQRIFYLPNKDLGLSRAWGVTTDHHGHVFVCGCWSNNVVKVTEDGHVVGEILSRIDGIECPQYLRYDLSRRQLCVGGGSDQILMVEWK